MEKAGLEKDDSQKYTVKVYVVVQINMINGETNIRA